MPRGLPSAEILSRESWARAARSTRTLNTKDASRFVVTVIYRYDTLVPFLGSAAPGFLKISSSTTMLGEY
jgi:hypothetical protein